MGADTWEIGPSRVRSRELEQEEIMGADTRGIGFRYRESAREDARQREGTREREERERERERGPLRVRSREVEQDEIVDADTRGIGPPIPEHSPNVIGGGKSTVSRLVQACFVHSSSVGHF